MTTPARKLAEKFSEECHGGYRDEALVESYCDVIEWLLAEQHKDYTTLCVGEFLALFDDGGKYGPPKPVTKDERIAKLRKALELARRRVCDNLPVMQTIAAALREDDEDGGTG